MVPYFLSELLHKAGAGTTLTAVAEAFVRVALFLGYLAAIYVVDSNNVTLGERVLVEYALR